MKQVHHQQSGYVLHTRPYRESSLLVDVFCRGHGRFMLNAKGARRQKSGMRGLLMPFRPLLLSWSGRGQLPILTAAESRGFVPVPAGQALHSAYYINELVLKMLHRFDEHDALFDQYEKTMSHLGNSDDVASALRLFEKSILGETGFGLVLDHDADTGELIEAQYQYTYIPEHGPIRTGKPPRNGISISGRALLSLKSDEPALEEVGNEIRNLHRSLITAQIGNREIRSRRVLVQVQNRLKRGGRAAPETRS